ncbi:MAG: (d)CMP kinase [Actinomycetota bacterium]|nr:(d)CMP kinase [Actinomycetota bacterium]MDI6822015.1 (d)CMP kinase [Actinomycetota bacterium]
MIIAIDGPAASGKSSVAKRIAQKLGLRYIDTGAMYRALTWKALQERIDIFDEEALVALAKQVKIHFVRPKEGIEERIFVDDIDVTEGIRSPKVGGAVSIVSRVPEVRRVMVEEQRALAIKDAVVEGRDIGTVVFPDAEVKIFLTAFPSERARRRKRELEEKGHKVDITLVEREIITRDEIDSTRLASPLSKAYDALLIDTTEKSIDQVVDEILGYIEGREEEKK